MNEMKVPWFKVR